MTTPNKAFLIDYIRFTVPLPRSPLNEVFVTKKGTELAFVRLSKRPIELLSSILLTMGFNKPLGLLKSHEELVEHKGFWGYDRTFEYSEIQFMYVDTTTADGRDNKTLEKNADMGVCVQLSGSACRRFETHLNTLNMNWWDFFHKLLVAYPATKIIRIDLTMDIKKHMQGVTPLAVDRQFAQGLVDSTTHIYDYHDGGDNRYGSHGDTFYLGSRSSDFYFRVYDKQKERYYSHGDKWLDPNGFWIRWEVELKHRLAQKAVERALNSKSHDNYAFYEVYLDILFTKMLFKPSARQLKKENYEVAERKYVNHKTGKVRKRKVKMATWYYQLISPEKRTKIKLHNLDRYKTGQELVDMQTVGSFFEKMAIHVLHGGDPFKLIAHWVQQGKMKRHDDKYNALIQKLKDAEYDPSIIDNMYSDGEAYSIIKDGSDDGVYGTDAMTGSEEDYKGTTAHMFKVGRDHQRYWAKHHPEGNNSYLY